MFNKIGIAGIFAGVLLTTTVANAIPIVNTVDVNTSLQTGDSVSYTHDLTDDNFDLGTATSGTIEIEFSDNTDADWEVILVVVDKFDFDTGGILISTAASSFFGDLEINALTQINSVGELDITIYSWWGDFTVGQSVLTLETNSVPEPGVLGMLGIGLLGLGVARRMRKT